MEDKKYYWIKLKTNFFDLPTIDWIMSQNNGCEYIVLYQMLCLKTANTDGKLVSQIGEMLIPYDIEKISRDTKYFSNDTIRVALELFKSLGLIYVSDDNTMTISNYFEMVGSESASKSAIKKREYRNRLREKQLIEQKEDNLEDNNKDKKGTNCPTEYRDKRLEIRDKSIEYRDKSVNKEKEEKEKRETYVSILDSYTSNETLKSSLNDFLEMRKKMKGFTTRAFKLALNKLDELSNDDEEKIKIVNQSVMNSWKSFYELKEETNKYPSWYKDGTQEKTKEESIESVKLAYLNTFKMKSMGLINDSDYKKRMENHKKMYFDLTGKDIVEDLKGVINYGEYDI